MILLLIFVFFFPAQKFGSTFHYLGEKSIKGKKNSNHDPNTSKSGYIFLITDLL